MELNIHYYMERLTLRNGNGLDNNCMSKLNAVQV
jgi:hypothetical protein